MRAISASRSFAVRFRARRSSFRCSCALLLGLVEHVVAIGPGRELREMRHADDLPARARARRCARRRRWRLRRRCRRRSRRKPAPSRVARAGEHDDQREQHARKLAARCDARERPRRLAGVRGKEKLDALGAVRPDPFERLERNVETRPSQARSRQTRRATRFDKRRGRFFAQRRQRGRRARPARASRPQRSAVKLATALGRDFRTRRSSGAPLRRRLRSSSTMPPYLRLSRSIRSRRALIASSSAGSNSAASSARPRRRRKIDDLGLQRRGALLPSRSAGRRTWRRRRARRRQRRARRWRRRRRRQALRARCASDARCARRCRENARRSVSRSSSPDSNRASSISRDGEASRRRSARARAARRSRSRPALAPPLRARAYAAATASRGRKRRGAREAVEQLEMIAGASSRCASCCPDDLGNRIARARARSRPSTGGR